jgi:hypothetical protein
MREHSLERLNQTGVQYRNYKSCFIPLLGDEKGSLVGKDEGENHFIDGGLPHIFNDDSREILYVSLVHINNIKGVLSTSGEKRHDARILQGIIDTYNFYKNEGQTTNMCSWFRKWKYKDIITNKLKILFVNATFIMFSILFRILPYLKYGWKVIEQSILSKWYVYQIIYPYILLIIEYIKYFSVELIVYLL